jgi:hypothetical protein
VPTGHILIYGKQQALPFRLLALCHLTDQAWYSAPAPWCKAGGKVAWASRPAIPAVLAARRPMALGFDQHHPGGMSENSPAFQRWDRSQRTSSPAGTAEAAVVSRPCGTSRGGRAHPALKRWAILFCPCGTGPEPRLPNIAYHSNPSGIGRDAFGFWGRLAGNMAGTRGGTPSLTRRRDAHATLPPALLQGAGVECQAWSVGWHSASSQEGRSFCFL